MRSIFPALLASTLLTLLSAAPAAAIDGAALLAGSAKMTGPAGWNDRSARISVQTFDDGAKTRDQQVDTQESLAENLTISTLTEFVAPADVRSLRVLDVWSPDSVGEVWVWAPQTKTFQKIPSDPNEPGYRDAQLLDLLPRMSEHIDVRVREDEPVAEGDEAVAEEGEADAADPAGAETAPAAAEDELDATVLDVDVGDRTWSLGRHFRVWISNDDERIQKIEARTAQGEVKRVVSVLTWSEADGRPTAMKVAIENPSTKRRSVFTRSNVSYDRGLPPETFQRTNPPAAEAQP